MPSIKGPCSVPRCPNISHHRGRCRGHAKLHEQQRGSRTQRGYNEDYQRLRVQVLREEKTCRYCGRVKGLTVDHIVPLPEGTNTRENLTACCKSCQRRRQRR